MTTFPVGGTFCYHLEIIFVKTIKTPGYRKVRFPLPEMEVSLIIIQIKQTLHKTMISPIAL